MGDLLPSFRAEVYMIIVSMERLEAAGQIVVEWAPPERIIIEFYDEDQFIALYERLRSR